MFIYIWWHGSELHGDDNVSSLFNKEAFRHTNVMLCHFIHKESVMQGYNSYN